MSVSSQRYIDKGLLARLDLDKLFSYLQNLAFIHSVLYFSIHRLLKSVVLQIAFDVTKTIQL